MKQTVLITGASSGIGKELAEIFAKNHYNLVLVARAQSILKNIAEQLVHQYAIEATVITKDLSKPEAAKEIYQELLDKKISIDILVNNAGFGTYGPFIESDLNESLGMIAVNVTTLTELTHLLLPAMLKKNAGKIMNVSSLGAFQACPTLAVYCATKAYILLFSEALAEELKNTNVSVTTICPGVTYTSFQARSNTDKTRIVQSRFNIMSAKDVAEISYDALQRKKGVVVVGWLNKLLRIFTHFMPRRLSTSMSGNLMREK